MSYDGNPVALAAFKRAHRDIQAGFLASQRIKREAAIRALCVEVRHHAAS